MTIRRKQPRAGGLEFAVPRGRIWRANAHDTLPLPRRGAAGVPPVMRPSGPSRSGDAEALARTDPLLRYLVPRGAEEEFCVLFGMRAEGLHKEWGRLTGSPGLTYAELTGKVRLAVGRRSRTQWRSLLVPPRPGGSVEAIGACRPRSPGRSQRGQEPTKPWRPEGPTSRRRANHGYPPASPRWAESRAPPVHLRP